MVLVLRGGGSLRQQTWWAGTCRRRAIGGQRSSQIRQGVRTHMYGYAPKIALGLGLRLDWGPQYTAHQFQGELAWLGIRSTASYVGEPECNGVSERFMRTLKEECLHRHDFESLEEARQEIARVPRALQPRVAPWSGTGIRTSAQVRQELYPEGGMIRPPTPPGNRDRSRTCSTSSVTPSIAAVPWIPSRDPAVVTLSSATLGMRGVPFICSIFEKHGSKREPRRHFDPAKIESNADPRVRV